MAKIDVSVANFGVVTLGDWAHSNIPVYERAARVPYRQRCRTCNWRGASRWAHNCWRKGQTPKFKRPDGRLYRAIN